MYNEVIETSEVLMVGDTFRMNLPGSKWMTVKGFRSYSNPKNKHLEYGGRTRVADVVDQNGRAYGITILPDQSFVYQEEI